MLNNDFTTGQPENVRNTACQGTDLILNLCSYCTSKTDGDYCLFQGPRFANKLAGKLPGNSKPSKQCVTSIEGTCPCMICTGELKGKYCLINGPISNKKVDWIPSDCQFASCTGNKHKHCMNNLNSHRKSAKSSNKLKCAIQSCNESH